MRNFREFVKAEVLRNSLPRSPVNKGNEKRGARLGGNGMGRPNDHSNAWRRGVTLLAATLSVLRIYYGEAISTLLGSPS